MKAYVKLLEEVNGKHCKISIPKEWIKKLKWKIRDELELRLTGDEIVVRKRR